MAQTISLKDVFIKSEETLKSSLRGLYLPRDYEKVQRVINEHIRKLLSDNNSIKSSLNASDAEYLNSILKMSLSFQKLSFQDTLDYAKMSIVDEYDINESINGSADILENTITLLPTVISAFFSPWLALGIGGATILYKKVNPSEKGKPQVLKRTVDKSKPITEDMLSDISEAIQSICQEIDCIINKIKIDRTDIIAKYQNDINNRTLEKLYPQILMSLQYIFAENIKNNKKDENLDSLIFNLGLYGYKVIPFSIEKSGFFKKQIKTGISVPEMSIPAIVKENEDGSLSLAAEGILYVPKQN